MAFTISEFRGKALNNAGARANLFDVTMTGASAAGLNASEFTFACKAAAIPAMAVATIDVPYFGRTIKVPGNKTFDNWTVTVINDEEFLIRNAMEKWLAAMGTHEGNIATIGNTLVHQVELFLVQQPFNTTLRGVVHYHKLSIIL